jgi:hypothetical protein
MWIWLRQQAWWIGIFLAILIALFPQMFTTMGTIIKFTLINYWLQMSVLIIITLLLIVYRRLLKQE